MPLRGQPAIRERLLQRWDSNKARLFPQKYNNNKLEDGKKLSKRDSQGSKGPQPR